MKNLIKTILLFILLVSSNRVMAQSTLTKEEAAEYSERLNQAGGTYQIQVIDSREKPALKVSVINEIDNARKENEVAYIYIKDNIRIKVLPLSLINSENFVAVERIVFINSSEL